MNRDIRLNPAGVTAENVKIAVGAPEGEEIVKTLTGIRPAEIISHVLGQSYTILGMTPTEFQEIHGGDVFDFDELMETFKTYCWDFQKDLQLNTVSKAVQFCSLILYTVGPESRTVKKNMADKTWEFKFPYGPKDDGRLDKTICKFVYVSTYKNPNAVYNHGSQTNGLVLSIKHASLLAMVTMSKITDIIGGSQNPSYMLTPLCGAIFSKIDIQAISMSMKLVPREVVKVLNESCQSAGHYLDNSDVTVAAIAAIVATTRLRSKGKADEANQIVTKIVKQYLSRGKDFSETTFAALAQYATGGVPAELSAKTLVKLFNDLQSAAPRKHSAMQIGRALKEGNLESKDLVKTMMEKVAEQSKETFYSNESETYELTGAVGPTPEEEEKEAENAQKVTDFFVGLASNIEDPRWTKYEDTDLDRLSMSPNYYLKDLKTEDCLRNFDRIDGVKKQMAFAAVNKKVLDKYFEVATDLGVKTYGDPQWVEESQKLDVLHLKFRTFFRLYTDAYIYGAPTQELDALYGINPGHAAMIKKFLLA